MAIRALGPFRLDTQYDLLFRGGECVALGQRAIALLRTLVERPGALVSKDALIARQRGPVGQSRKATLRFTSRRYAEFYARLRAANAGSRPSPAAAIDLSGRSLRR